MLVRASARRRRGSSIQGDGHLRARLKLPFAPTGAQRRANEEIAGDMAQGQPMLRLLQGDVGAGQTLMALMALLNAGEAGADRKRVVSGTRWEGRVYHGGRHIIKNKINQQKDQV